MKWNAKVFTDATFDFEIEADTEEEVKSRLEQYLEYVPGGEPKGHAISVKTKPGDTLTGLFIMRTEIEDVYELE